MTSDTTRIEIELSSAVGPRVLYQDGVDAEEIEAALPEGYALSETQAVRTDTGRWSQPLVQVLTLDAIDIATSVATHCQDEGLEAGYDVSVTVSWPGHTVDGEVTLVPDEARPDHYSSWGEPAHWVSGELLSYLEQHLSEDLRREVLGEIAGLAALEIEGLR